MSDSVLSQFKQEIKEVFSPFKGEKLKFRSKVIVSYGKPISPEELKIDSADTRAMKRIKTTIMNGIAELVNENVNKL